MINTFVTALAGYQDLLYINQLNEVLINKNININNKQFIFLLSKNTLSLFLPNNGKVFGYSLFNNSMNFIYNNYTLKEEDSIPLKINHNLVYDNGNTVIDSKSFKNFFYKNKTSTKITILEDSNTTNSSNEYFNSHFTNMQAEVDIKDDVENDSIDSKPPTPNYLTDTTNTDSNSESSIIEDKNKAVTNNNQNNLDKSITLEVKDDSSNESLNSKTIINNEKIQEDVDKKDDVENDLIIDTRLPLNADTSSSSSNSNNSSSSNSSSSNDSSSSSSSNMINNEEKIVEFNNTIIKVQNNIITEVNGTSFIKPIISDEELKYYLDHGCTRNIFLNNFYYDLHKKNSYPIFKKIFFSLDNNFREEFKILITFFDQNKFTLDKNIINWFINNKIEPEIAYIETIIYNLDLNICYLKDLDKFKNEEDYYLNPLINFRNNLANIFNNRYKTDDYTYYNNSLDDINLLEELIDQLSIFIYYH